MVKQAFLLLLALLTVSANGLAATPEPDFPATFAWKYEGTPGLAWISAKAVLDDEGNPRWDLLSDSAAWYYERALESSDFSLRVESCSLFDDRPRESLEAMAEHATAIFRGQIVGMAPGFWAESTPVLLLKVRVESTLRTTPAFTSEPDLYVVYLGAVFEFAGARLRSPDPGFDHRPAVGEKVMLFPYGEPQDIEGRLLSVDPGQIFFETANGLTAEANLYDHGEIQALVSIEALEALTRCKMAGDPSARAFDERTCTPAPRVGFERSYERRACSQTPCGSLAHGATTARTPCSSASRRGKGSV